MMENTFLIYNVSIVIKFALHANILLINALLIKHIIFLMKLSVIQNAWDHAKVALFHVIHVLDIWKQNVVGYFKIFIKHNSKQ